MRTINISLVFIALGLFVCSSRYKEINKGDRFRVSILDSANLLTDTQEDSIAFLINNLEDEIGSQIGVVTIKSLRGEEIEVYSLRTAKLLRLGRSTHNDGLLITVALQDRRIRIEVGTGLENIIRDEIAARFNRELMAPNFRQGKFSKGIYLAVDSISTRIMTHKEMVGQQPRWK